MKKKKKEEERKKENDLRERELFAIEIVREEREKNRSVRSNGKHEYRSTRTWIIRNGHR